MPSSSLRYRVGLHVAQACSGPDSGPGQPDALWQLVSVVDWLEDHTQSYSRQGWEPTLQGGVAGQEKQLTFTQGASLTTLHQRGKSLLLSLLQRPESPIRAHGRLCCSQSPCHGIMSPVKTGTASYPCYCPFFPAQAVALGLRPTGVWELKGTHSICSFFSAQSADGTSPLQVAPDLTGAHVDGLPLCRAFACLIE